MLMRSNNTPKDDKDWLAIGQMEYKETNPFGYKDYKETFDNIHWWKTVEYTDEKGEKVVKEINPLGQIMIHQFVNIRENTGKKKETNLDEALLDENKTKPKKEINLDDALLEGWDFDVDQKENKKKQRYDWEDTPEPEPDENNLSENDFYRMDWKKAQYQIYRLLLNISSSLSDIQEVAKQNDK